LARRTAKHCSIYINAVKVADAYNTTINVSPEFIEHRAYGDNFKQREVDICDWSVDSEKYVAVAGAMGYYLDGALTQASAASPSPYTLTVYQLDGDNSTKLIEGPVWFGEASIELSNGSLVGEKGAFVAAGDPTFWIGM
jgi:hypothetical protein